MLRFVEGMEIEQVAGALDVSVPTTRRALARAWERIALLASGDGFLTRYVGAPTSTMERARSSTTSCSTSSI